MRGWIYLIKNGDLYKIGITMNFEQRMRQLKPDTIVAKLYTKNFKALEKYFHKKYKRVRLPQTEYFRLNHFQIRDFIQSIKLYNFSYVVLIKILIKSFFSLTFLCVLFSWFLYLLIADINKSIYISVVWTERLSYCLAIISFLKKSDNCFGFFYELKIRFIKVIIFLLCAICIRYIHLFYFN